MAGGGRDAGLVAELLTTSPEDSEALDGLLEAPDAPELVMLAAETVEAAERVGGGGGGRRGEEVSSETLGLLRAVPTAAPGPPVAGSVCRGVGVGLVRGEWVAQDVVGGGQGAGGSSSRGG